LNSLSIELVQEIYTELENHTSKKTSKDWRKELKNYLPPALLNTLELNKEFQITSTSKTYDSEQGAEQEVIEINKLKMENSLMDYIQEIGYGFTANAEDCRSALQSFNSGIKDYLNAVNVAKVLGMMARTHNNLNADWQFQNEFENKEGQPTWNPEVFATVVQELAPKIDFKNVVKELDHAEFIIRDRVALKLIVQTIKRVLRDQFPIEHIYRVWKNTEGQVKLL